MQNASDDTDFTREVFSDADKRQSYGDGSGISVWLRRIYARRFLLASVYVTLIVFKLGFSLPLSALIAGAALVTLVAAFAPREGIIHISRPLATSTGKTLTPADIITPLLQGFPDPVILLTATCNVLLMNEKAAEVFEDMKPGRHISGLIRHPQVLDAVNRVKAEKAPQTVIYAERVPVERHMAATISWIGTPALSAQDDPCILIFLRDLTEQERLDQMRADFVAYASHELKTPLASVIGFIETLQGRAKDDPEARGRFLDIMLRQAERMSRLIENLLSLSRVEMRAHLKPDTPIDLGEVVQHAVQALEPLAAGSNVTVEVQEFSGEAIVLGDRDEMTQVFQNLIHNSIKYGRDGGVVRVRIARLPGDKRGGGRLAVTVEDDGLGIAPQHLPRLTERFYRVSQGAAADKNGTGLGLAIASQVITRHRGELKISSQIGEGSVFTVILTEQRMMDRDNEIKGYGSNRLQSNV